MRDADTVREIEPLIGYNLSVIVGAIALGISLWLGQRLPLPSQPGSFLLVSVAFFTCLVGFVLLITRSKAITQVLGYLILENGVYAFGAVVAVGMPILVELGILLDVFVGVFVMGIAIFHISRQFDHIDTDRLVTLSDRVR
jgi:hydrogenase-4 component E